MKKRRWGFLAGLAVLVLLAAACSDVSNDNSGGSSGATGASGGSQVPDNSGTTINLADQPVDGLRCERRRGPGAPAGQAGLYGQDDQDR